MEKTPNLSDYRDPWPLRLPFFPDAKDDDLMRTIAIKIKPTALGLTALLGLGLWDLSLMAMILVS